MRACRTQHERSYTASKGNHVSVHLNDLLTGFGKKVHLYFQTGLRWKPACSFHIATIQQPLPPAGIFSAHTDADLRGITRHFTECCAVDVLSSTDDPTSLISSFNGVC